MSGNGRKTNIKLERVIDEEKYIIKTGRGYVADISPKRSVSKLVEEKFSTFAIPKEQIENP